MAVDLQNLRTKRYAHINNAYGLSPTIVNVQKKIQYKIVSLNGNIGLTQGS